ncbi:MAG: T9SS C-terminal target domain-containing protein, partial [Candidatus Neomarinimicrobiota bacterium]
AHRSRYPDGGSWELRTPTPGKSNSTEKFVQEGLPVPEVFALYQNYPNPFNAQTTISFDLLQPATVSLYILDARGRLVESFLEETPLNRGTFTFTWDATHYSSGIYFFTLSAQVGDYLPIVFSRKMIYLK